MPFEETESQRPGRVTGTLSPGEDRKALERALIHARQLVLDGELSLLLHADHRPELSAPERDALRAERVRLLRAGRLKRFVLRIETSAGPRIVKISEVTTFGGRLKGLLGDSNARLEHRCHLRTERLGLAATHATGFLELRDGPLLRRACQMQTPLPDERQTLEVFFRQQLDSHGEAAVESLASAIADTHNRGFFHADVKGFHAFPHQIQQPRANPATYALQWIDLGRVSFWLSPRKRVINLYQVFRFILPNDAQIRERFMGAYCRQTGWRAANPHRAVRRVERFLDRKRISHPNPFA